MKCQLLTLCFRGAVFPYQTPWQGQQEETRWRGGWWRWGRGGAAILGRRPQSGAELRTGSKWPGLWGWCPPQSHAAKMTCIVMMEHISYMCSPLFWPHKMLKPKVVSQVFSLVYWMSACTAQWVTTKQMCYWQSLAGSRGSMGASLTSCVFLSLVLNCVHRISCVLECTFLKLGCVCVFVFNLSICFFSLPV